MVAIGRTLMSRPKLLLLDEPSLGLAPIVVNGIFKAIRVLRTRGTTILLVEQNAKAALKVADRGLRPRDRDGSSWRGRPRTC